MLTTESIELSPLEEQEILGTMSDCHRILTQKCVEFGFVSIRHLRAEYFKLRKHKLGKGTQPFDHETRTTLDRMRSLEPKLLAAFVLMIHKFANSFYTSFRDSRPQLDKEDYEQEAAWALFDAIYLHNGSTRLSTYFYHAIKRRLCGFVEKQERHSGMGRGIQHVRRKLIKIMKNKDCSFDQAVMLFGEEFGKLSAKSIEMVRHSFYTVASSDFERCTIKEHSIDDEIDRKADSAKIRQTVSNVDLNPLQQEMLDYFLDTGDRLDTQLTQRINLKTGDYYTRQAVSQQWGKLIEKLQLHIIPEKEAA